MRVVFSNCSPLRLNKLPKISCVFTQVCELLALWKSRPYIYESSVSYRAVVGVSESVTTEAMMAQSALEFCPIHCPNGRLGQDLGFGGIAFALKLPELLNGNLAAVRAKLGQTSCFPNGP